MDKKTAPTEKIGLITFHSAYNFGSVMQTYATVQAIEALGYDVEVIDYRTSSQKRFYNKSRFSFMGVRTLINSLKSLKIRKQRKIRKSKYESFIANYLKPSQCSATTYQEVLDIFDNYDILISGSDQIWNIRCWEFMNEPFDSIKPYYLQFGHPKKRIAFSSSFGDNTFNHVKKYHDMLLGYDYLSTREPNIKIFIEKITSKPTELVCDPTWLMNKEEWLQTKGVYKPDHKKYLFIYTLHWNFKSFPLWEPYIKSFAEKNGLEIVIVAPLHYIQCSGIKILHDAGPLDILSYLAYSSFIMTTTFHGTMFALNFNIPFYSINTTVSSRQGQILQKCDLTHRIINHPKEIQYDDITNCNFSDTNKYHNNIRLSSLKFLENALN